MWAPPTKPYSGNTVQLTFGPSGTLKDQIASGAKADVFASANLQHPQALHDAGKSGPVVLFARNKLCALATPLLKVTSDNLLDRMLDGEVKLAISTPLADPSGDYALRGVPQGGQDQARRAGDAGEEG